MIVAARKFNDSESSTTYERGEPVKASPRRLDELRRQGLVEDQLEKASAEVVADPVELPADQQSDAETDQEQANEQPAEVVADSVESKQPAKPAAKGRKS